MPISTSDLGLSCPAKGQFYACDTAKIRFVGCCTIDPCADGSGNCPQSSLASTSFSSDYYASIPPQNCAAPRNSSNWWTCAGSQPFLGCCDINPCQNSGCPTASLLPAILSDDASNAEVFIASSTSTTAASPGSSGYTLPLGAIIGIVIGCAALVAIILAFVAYRCGWIRRKKQEKGNDQPTPDYSTYSPAMQQWQDGTHSGAPSPGYPSPSYPGFAPYSPTHHQHPYPPPSSSPPQESWHGDSRHTSHISELSGWTGAASADNKKHHSYSPLLNLPASELDSRNTERQFVAELPTSPTNHAR